MRRLLFFLGVFWLQAALSLAPSVLRAQAGFNDDRVMLQGFYWESHRHGQPGFEQFGSKKWYEIVRDLAPEIRGGRFDMVWLPPPSQAGDVSAGYDPREYYNLSNSYGDFGQHRAMLEALLNNGVEPIADIVINHRNGLHHWADFSNPDWGTRTIARSDEAFSSSGSEVNGTPIDQRGAEEEQPVEYTSHGGTTFQYGSFRDIDHTNPTVRRDIIRYLLQLKSIGYRGWRYDMVHGFHAHRLATYNRATNPTFSVGEYDWDKQSEQRGWVWHTATTPGDMTTSSSVFDFRTFFTLKDNKGNYGAWYGFGEGLGLVGDNTDGHPWKNRAVTFLENHDTGFRTHPDGTPENDHEADNFANNWEVEQAYAQILSLPGTPTVYWKHYFDWGSDLRNKIRALINARKVAGVHAGSPLHLQNNAQARGVYAAHVVGDNGDLFVRVGGDDSVWQPSHSGHHDYRRYARGAGWTVWVKLPGNPEVQQAPLNAALPIPSYREPSSISVPDSLLD